MIKYEWRTELSPSEADELANLLDRAARYDAEPEYSTIDFADVNDSLAAADPAVRHLLIWMLAHPTALSDPDEPDRIAGLVRLTRTSEDSAEATVVVDPELRSIGIVTLLVESAGLDTGTEVVTAWARGNHPAAGRLSNRFLIPRTRRIWKLIRSCDPSPDSAAAPVLEPLSGSALQEISWYCPASGRGQDLGLRESGRVVGAMHLNLQPVQSDEFGDCATVDRIAASPASGSGELRRLLQSAAVHAHEAGLTGLVIFVDSDDLDLVHAARLVGFQHDRTDVRYQIGRHDG